MRIDEFDRPHDVEGTDKAQQAGSHEQDTSADPPGEHATMSVLGLDNLAQKLDCANTSRIKALRLQLESGNYDVSADELATKIIESHVKP